VLVQERQFLAFGHGEDSCCQQSLVRSLSTVILFAHFGALALRADQSAGGLEEVDVQSDQCVEVL
jgi:hypothetical protein